MKIELKRVSKKSPGGKKEKVFLAKGITGTKWMGREEHMRCRERPVAQRDGSVCCGVD